MKETIVNSIQDYLDVIDEIDRRYPSDRYKSALIFRGHTLYEHRLLPSVYREYTEERDGHLCVQPLFGNTPEHVMLQHFIKNAMNIVDNTSRDDMITWLTYAQHFGAPTRLLDFSANPLISLFFSCRREWDRDGCVCVFHETNYVRSMNLHTIPGRRKKEVLEEIEWNIQDPSVLCTPFPVTFIPHYIDGRMEAQESRFLVWGSRKKPIEEIAQPYGDMLSGERGAFFCKIRIAGALKRRLLQELSFLGINEKKLFPGLDGVGRYISTYYCTTDLETY